MPNDRFDRSLRLDGWSVLAGILAPGLRSWLVSPVSNLGRAVADGASTAPSCSQELSLWEWEDTSLRRLNETTTATCSRRRGYVHWTPLDELGTDETWIAGTSSSLVLWRDGARGRSCAVAPRTRQLAFAPRRWSPLVRRIAPGGGSTSTTLDRIRKVSPRSSSSTEKGWRRSRMLDCSSLPSPLVPPVRPHLLSPYRTLTSRRQTSSEEPSR
jgi:hypothetical protein